jgi:predicted N-acyltransferase
MQQISVSVAPSILQISSEDWDACAIDASGHDNFNPFLTHAFLSSLEETGCSTTVGSSTELCLLQNMLVFLTAGTIHAGDWVDPSAHCGQG